MADHRLPHSCVPTLDLRINHRDTSRMADVELTPDALEQFADLPRGIVEKIGHRDRFYEQ